MLHSVVQANRATADFGPPFLMTLFLKGLGPAAALLYSKCDPRWTL
jgi:hypothetical protein